MAPEHDEFVRRNLGGSGDAAGGEVSVGEARRRIAYLEQEIELLRAKAAESPRHIRLLEERLAEAQAKVAGLADRNDRLSDTLRDARDQMLALKEEIDRLAQPPSGFGVFLEAQEDGTVDIFTGGRKLRVAVAPGVEVDDLDAAALGAAQNDEA